MKHTFHANILVTKKGINMKLILSNGITFDNIVADGAMLEIEYNNYQESQSIYSSISNETLNGSRWETSTGVVMGGYNNVEIVNAITLNNRVRFILQSEREAEIQRLLDTVSQQSAQIAELTSLVDALVVTTLESPISSHVEQDNNSTETEEVSQPESDDIDQSSEESDGEIDV